jgi:hypothetical protein
MNYAEHESSVESEKEVVDESTSFVSNSSPCEGVSPTENQSNAQFSLEASNGAIAFSNDNAPTADEPKRDISESAAIIPPIEETAIPSNSTTSSPPVDAEPTIELASSQLSSDVIPNTTPTIATIPHVNDEQAALNSEHASGDSTATSQTESMEAPDSPDAFPMLVISRDACDSRHSPIDSAKEVTTEATSTRAILDDEKKESVARETQSRNNTNDAAENGARVVSNLESGSNTDEIDPAVEDLVDEKKHVLEPAIDAPIVAVTHSNHDNSEFHEGLCYFLVVLVSVG